ncbi:hypothetical protein GCM10009001_30190 [Virgibacillus siamensis]|uniref:Transposase n=1 Tax=Virgibacillus siamensis TaxID=480071 RepID=A0ABN1GGB8_9BACI
MKNHINVNGKLLQTNKRFSQLKERQKNWITEELYKLYHKKMKERRINGKLPPPYRDEVIESIYEQIRDRDIWIPFGEVKKYAFRKTTKMVKSFNKLYPELSDKIEIERSERKKQAFNNKSQN